MQRILIVLWRSTGERVKKTHLLSVTDVSYNVFLQFILILLRTHTSTTHTTHIHVHDHIQPLPSFPVIRMITLHSLSLLCNDAFTLNYKCKTFYPAYGYVESYLFNIITMWGVSKNNVILTVSSSEYYIFVKNGYNSCNLCYLNFAERSYHLLHLN